MSLQAGADLGGIKDLEGLRERCFVDEETGCWHLRTARGRPLPRHQRHVVWVHGVGHVTATRAAWLLAKPGREVRPGWVCFRRCESHDCVNPAYLSTGTRKQLGRHMQATGKAVTPAKTAACRVLAQQHPKTKLTPETRAWLFESQQSGIDAAHGLGITQGRANVLRAKHRQALAARPVASVFELGSRAGEWR
ncbi:MAG: hypothetical protein ACRC1H_17805 [Caldilineaceae bacterium]